MQRRRLRLPLLSALPLLVLATCVACATQREQRLSSAEARERPTDEACEPKGQPPAPGFQWACGYWHWEAVRYVWVEGQWRPPSAP
jgi:hypothetical protein